MDETFAQSYFYRLRHLKTLITTQIPVWEALGNHIWTGVLPRPKPNVKTPEYGHILWCDFDNTITSRAQMDAAISESKLPYPSMVVFSGNGYHAYWKFRERIPARDISPYSRGVHEALPTDTTHDPTRVMRLPGTINPKHGRLSVIEDIYEDNIYEWDEFPQAEYQLQEETPFIAPRFRPLSVADMEKLASCWEHGRRHSLIMYASGYMRKNLGHTREECIGVWEEIAHLKGERVDDHLIQVVNTTYEQTDSNRIAGFAALKKNFGIELTSSDVGSFTVKDRKSTAPKPRANVNSRSKVNLLQPNESIEQEWWMKPVCGPGLITMLAAETKVGKTFLAMQMAYGLMTGTDVLGLTIPERKRVLYYQAELNGNMIAERWDGMFGRQSRNDVSWLGITTPPSTPIDLVTEPEQLYDVAEHYDVIFIDTVSNYFRGNESAKQDVLEFLEKFQWLRELGKSVFLIHHVRKLWAGLGANRRATANDVRGSGLWTSFVDATMILSKMEAHHLLSFELRAARDIPDIPLWRMDNGSFTHDYEDVSSANGGAVTFTKSVRTRREAMRNYRDTNSEETRK